MSEIFNLGMLLSKVGFWSKQYDISFQFWGQANNNVFISNDLIELASFGGRDTIKEILEDTIEWCEKANPSKKYPPRLTITNVQP